MANWRPPTSSVPFQDRASPFSEHLPAAPAAPTVVSHSVCCLADTTEHGPAACCRVGMPRARTLTGDVMVGVSSLCTLAAGASIISPDVRAQVNTFAADPGVQLSALASRAMDFGNMLVRSAGDYTPDSTPFMGFAIVAVVLTLMMFRS